MGRFVLLVALLLLLQTFGHVFSLPHHPFVSHFTCFDQFNSDIYNFFQFLQGQRRLRLTLSRSPWNF